MTLKELKRFTMLFLLMAGLYVSVFMNNLSIFIAEVFCFGAWSTFRAIPNSINNIKRDHYDGE